MAGKPLEDFLVYRREGDCWVFWMNARGKSARQIRQSVVWNSQGKITRDDVNVVPANKVKEN